MARVYKHQYSGGRVSKKWYIEFTDHAGRVRRQPAYRDKALSIDLLAQTLRREEKIRAGHLSPHEVLPASPLGELLERWRAYTIGKGACARHADQYKRGCERVFRACGFFDVRSLNAARAQDYLDGLTASGKTNRTHQWYRAALNAFGNWLALKEKLIPSNPFTAIDKRDPALNCKIVRRVLSEAEFRRFLKAARSGRKFESLTGETRYFLYLVAAYSGLRLGALIRLTPSHFNLSANPSVTSTASLQKNRKAHTVPLPRSIVASLREWFKSKQPDGLLFGNANRKHAARFVRFDLKAAQIPYVTAEGRFDFHSLRHQFGTMLARSGASTIEVQHLLDHSSPTLSARYFRHLKTEELRKPVERLPKL